MEQITRNKFADLRRHIQTGTTTERDIEDLQAVMFEQWQSGYAVGKESGEFRRLDSVAAGVYTLAAFVGGFAMSAFIGSLT